MQRCLIFIATAACLMAGCENGTIGFGSDKDNFKPENQQHTILLALYKGPAHVRLAAAAKSDLSAQGWKDIFVVHEADHSALYSGHYDTTDAASGDLKRAKQFMLANGRHPFDKAIIVNVPGSKDKGPEKWNLKNAVGRYSVMVAIFYDIPEQNYYGRRERAVRLCKELRKRGEEGYFFHGPNKSGVTIGTFGPDAIKKESFWREHPVTKTRFKQERNRIIDPRMQKIIDMYPELLICGNIEITKRIEIVNGRPKEVKEVQPSYPVGIPGWEQKIGNQRKQHKSPRRRKIDRTDYIGFP